MAEPIVNNQNAPSLEAIAGIESLGQADNVEVFTTVAQTSKDFYAIYFVTESVISAIVSNQASNASELVTTILTSSNKLMLYSLRLLIVHLNKPLPQIPLHLQ